MISEVSNNLTTLNRAWQPAKVIPLSANIQWVFYKKAGSENYLVKLLLNEKAVKIAGLKSDIAPYYGWEQLRAFYIKKLTRLNVKLSDNMAAYLNNVK